MADVGISVELTGATGVAAGLSKIDQGAKSLGATAAQSAKGMQSLGASAGFLKGALGALVSFQAVSWIQKLEQGMEDTARASQRLGISFEKLQGMELVAKRLGVATQTVALAMTQLAKNAGEAVAQPLSMQARLFNALGVSQGFLAKNLGNTDAVLRKTITGISELGSKSEQTKAITALFGDQAIGLFDEFTRGNKTLDDLIQGFKDMGLIIDNKAAKTLTDLDSDFTNLTDSAETFIKKVLVGGMLAAEDFAASIQNISDKFKNMDNGFSSRGGLPAEAAWMMRNTPAPGSVGSLPTNFKGIVPTITAGPPKRTIAGALDTQAAAEAMKTKQVLAQLDIQYQQLTSHIVGFNQKTAEQTALLHLGRNATQADKDAVKQKTEQMAVAAAALEDWNQKLAHNNALMQFGIDLYTATRTPLEQYKIGLESLNEWYDKNKDKSDLYARALEALDQKLASTSHIAGDFSQALGQGLEDAVFSGKKLWKVLQDMERELGKSIFKNLFSDRLVGSLSRSLGKALGGDALEKGMDRVFDKFLGALGSMFEGNFGPFLDGLTSVFDGAWSLLKDTIAPWIDGIGKVLWEFLGELGIMHALHEAGLWAVTLWDVAQKWAIAIFEAAIGLLGFAHGGDMTVTRPTLIMVGERGAERVRVSPLAGRNARGSSAGDGGMIGGSGGGGAAVNVFLPQSSVVSGITAGNFARQISRTVNRENGRQV